MQAIDISEPGGPEKLHLVEVPTPHPAPGEVLIKVAATALNRADLLQRQGFYPPPPGASPILGMECSGTIERLGADVTDWQIGDQVCALLAGGGYAEYAAVPAGQVLPVPRGIGLIEAAALPEVACTVWSNVVMTAGLSRGQTVLIHGGASGIGTMAIQVAKALGARIAVTASRDVALRRCQEFGAEILINYLEADFAEELNRVGGADVILDVIGAKYLQRNVSALAAGGQLVIIGMQGGIIAEFNLSALMAKNGTVTATRLRPRPVSGPGSKSEIVTAVREHLWPMIEAGSVIPVIDTVLPLSDAAQAHERMEAGGHIGKILLRIAG